MLCSGCLPPLKLLSLQSRRHGPRKESSLPPSRRCRRRCPLPKPAAARVLGVRDVGSDCTSQGRSQSRHEPADCDSSGFSRAVQRVRESHVDLSVGGRRRGGHRVQRRLHSTVGTHPDGGRFAALWLGGARSAAEKQRLREWCVQPRLLRCSRLVRCLVGQQRPALLRSLQPAGTSRSPRQRSRPCSAPSRRAARSPRTAVSRR